MTWTAWWNECITTHEFSTRRGGVNLVSAMREAWNDGMEPESFCNSYWELR
jgi:hypothetical protein